MKYPMSHKVKRPFVWTSAAATDIRKTFARVRQEMKKAAPNNVKQLRKEAA